MKIIYTGQGSERNVIASLDNGKYRKLGTVKSLSLGDEKAFIFTSASGQKQPFDSLEELEKSAQTTPRSNDAFETRWNLYIAMRAAEKGADSAWESYVATHHPPMRAARGEPHSRTPAEIESYAAYISAFEAAVAAEMAYMGISRYPQKLPTEQTELEKNAHRFDGQTTASLNKSAGTKMYPKAYKAYENAMRSGKRIPEDEAIIAKSPRYAYFYAKDIIKGRWPEGEAAIAEDPEYKELYENSFE